MKIKRYTAASMREAVAAFKATLALLASRPNVPTSPVTLLVSWVVSPRLPSSGTESPIVLLDVSSWTALLVVGAALSIVNASQPASLPLL